MKFSEYLITSECEDILLDLHNTEMEMLIESILEGQKKIVPAHVKHPLINPKTGRTYRYDERITHLEFIKKALKTKGVHPKEIWVSFTDLEKLGINPKTTWTETPIGLYAYPIRYAIKMMRDNPDDLFASAKPWIQVLITKKKNDKGKMMQTSSINAGRDPLYLLNQYRMVISKHLQKVWKIENEDLEEFFGEPRDEVQWYQVIARALDSLQQSLYKSLTLSGSIRDIKKVNWDELVDGFWDILKNSEYLDIEENLGEKSIRFINKTLKEYWTHVKRLIKRGKQGRIPFEDVLKKFAEKHPEVDFEKTKEWVKSNSFNSDIGVLYQVAKRWSDKLSDTRPWITWSAILRKMGVSGISDIGTDTIYASEPTQAVFLTPGTWEHVATVPNFENPTHKQVEGRPSLKYAQLADQFRRQYKVSNEYLWDMNLWKSFLKAEWRKRKGLPQDFDISDSVELTGEFNDWFNNLKDEADYWDEDRGAHSIVSYGRSSGYKNRSSIRGTTEEMTKHSLETTLRKTLEVIEAAVDSKREDWEKRAIRQTTHAIHLVYSWRKLTKEKPSLNNRQILKRFYDQAMQDADMKVYMSEFLRRLKHLHDAMESDELPDRKSYGQAFVPNIRRAKKFFQINYPGEEKLDHIDKAVRFKPLNKLSGFERISWGGEALSDWIDFQQKLGIISSKDAADIRKHHSEFLGSLGENRFWEDGDLNTFSSSGDGSGAFRGQCGDSDPPGEIDKKDNMRRKFKKLRFSKKKSSKR